MLRFSLIAAAAVAIVAGPAQAVTFTTTGAGPMGDPGVGASEQIITGFDGADVVSYDAGHSWGFGLYTGSYSGLAAAPAGDSSQYMAIGTGGSVLFDLRNFLGANAHLDSVSVYLGSVDSYNYIDVLGMDANGALNFSSPLFTLGGSDLPPSNGDWYSSATNRRVSFGFGDDEKVGGLIFRSNGVAFEFDSIAAGKRFTLPPEGENAAAVPEPASWAMMLGGFGMIGGAMRSRRTKLAFARP